MSSNNPESEILDYLRQKHGEGFRVLQLTDENSGYEGRFLRAVCRSDSIEEPFVLYVYQNTERGDEKATVGGRAVGVRDEYPNVRLQREYAKLLRGLLPEATFIGCTVETMGRCFTAEEVNAGLASCARVQGTDAFVTAYVITDSPETGETLFSGVREELSALPFYRQYLYFGRSSGNEDYWKTQFADHYSSFDSFFMREGYVENPVSFRIPENDAAPKA